MPRDPLTIRRRAVYSPPEPQEENDLPMGAPPVVILSEAIWRDRFAADPNLTGSSVNLDHRS
jgi:hypothetical protein